MTHHAVPLIARISMQSKIAELERRIAVLEAQRLIVTKTTTVTHVDVEPEMSRMWGSFDALFKKVFK